MSGETKQIGEAVQRFLDEHPDVTNPMLIFHGILEANPELRDNKEFDLESIGRMVQHCENPPT